MRPDPTDGRRQLRAGALNAGRELGQRKAERDLGLLPARQRLHRTVERHPQPREPLLRSDSIPPAVEMGADPEVLGGRQLPVQVDVLSQKADARACLGTHATPRSDAARNSDGSSHEKKNMRFSSCLY
jgi:hypothetical protein